MKDDSTDGVEELQKPQPMKADSNYSDYNHNLLCYDDDDDNYGVPSLHPDHKSLLRFKSFESSAIINIARSDRFGKSGTILDSHDQTLSMRNLWFIYLSRFRKSLSNFPFTDPYVIHGNVNLVNLGNSKITRQALLQFLHVIEAIAKISQKKMLDVHCLVVNKNKNYNVLKDAKDSVREEQSSTLRFRGESKARPQEEMLATGVKNKMESPMKIFSSTPRLNDDNKSLGGKSRFKGADAKKPRQESFPYVQNTVLSSCLTVAAKNPPKKRDNFTLQQFDDHHGIDYSTASNASHRAMAVDSAQKEEIVISETCIQTHKAICLKRTLDTSCELQPEVKSRTRHTFDNEEILKKGKNKKANFEIDDGDVAILKARPKTRPGTPSLHSSRNTNGQTHCSSSSGKAEELFDDGKINFEVKTPSSRQQLTVAQPAVEELSNNQNLNLTKHATTKKKRKKKHRKKVDKHKQIAKKRKRNEHNDARYESQLNQPVLSKVTLDATRQKSEAFEAPPENCFSSFGEEDSIFHLGYEGCETIVRNIQKGPHSRLLTKTVSGLYQEELQTIPTTEDYKQRLMHKQSQTNNVTQVICSESLMEGLPEIVQALVLGNWAEGSIYSTHDTDLTPYQQIMLHNTTLLDDSGVDIEIAGKKAAIVRKISTFGGNKHLTQTIRSLVKLTALGRYRTIHFFLCVDCELSESIARDIAFLQSAHLGNEDCVVLFEIMSKKSLATAIARICLVGKATCGIATNESYFEPLRDTHFVERARFLLQLISSLTVHDTFRFLPRGDKSMTSHSLQRVFNSDLTRKCEDKTQIQLSSAAFAPLGNYGL
eukprot:CAMPEP_0194235312 /NCGR_PEP_ID=MMETSP0158-20130606/2848_1 /TAXON_ID=33649 /ORGANISM="Thalassionema nitzschioides, Strain L26-B" /LENGTH=822 /DNA_ID=CAMNT_0038968767 /DNA_START=39 /DNA_END=2507 /DNA_ORIENTATION=+